MQETAIPVEGVASRDSNVESHRGRNFRIPQPIAEEEQQQQQLEPTMEETDTKESPAAVFIDSVKKFFAPCVGAVDAASFYIGECRASNLDSSDDKGENIAEDVIMRLRERNGGFRQQKQKRRNETLEIPTHGMLFDDDDVSAISSHTLEEMERLRTAQNSRLSTFHMSPTINYSNIMRPKSGDKLNRDPAGACPAAYVNKQNREIKKSQESNQSTELTNHLSICVSASDSTNSEEMEQRKQDATGFYSTPLPWGSKTEKDEGFKTHRVG